MTFRTDPRPESPWSPVVRFGPSNRGCLRLPVEREGDTTSGALGLMGYKRSVREGPRSKRERLGTYKSERDGPDLLGVRLQRSESTLHRRYVGEVERGSGPVRRDCRREVGGNTENEYRGAHNHGYYSPVTLSRFQRNISPVSHDLSVNVISHRSQCRHWVRRRSGLVKHSRL